MLAVDFNESKHEYRNSSTNEKYISVTQLIHRYENPFDTDFWSDYKAIQRVLIQVIGEDAWNKWKRDIGGFKKVNKSFFAQAKPENIALQKEYKKVILQEWRAKNEKSCDEGSKFHKDKEDYWKSKWKHKYKNRLLPYQIQEAAIFETGEIRDGVYTELRVWDHKRRVAGHVDLPIIHKPTFTIRDYKTNEKLEFDNYKDPETGHAMLKYPFHNLKDCNGNIYTIQLSTYAWLIEQAFGIKVEELVIDYAVRDFKNNLTEDIISHPVEYLKNEVETMMEMRLEEVNG